MAYHERTRSFANQRRSTSTSTGNYENHIIQVLEAEGQQTTETYIDNSLFSCGSGGDITYVQYCDNGCNGVGSDDADACLTA